MPKQLFTIVIETDETPTSLARELLQNLYSPFSLNGLKVVYAEKGDKTEGEVEDG